MKQFIQLIGTLLAILGFAIAVYGSVSNHNYSMSTTLHDSPMFEDEVVVLDYFEPEVIQEVPVVRTGEFLNLTFKEMDELEAIAWAEARGEGVEGMALVMNVVINRSKKTGKSIHDVIYAPHQFYTAGMSYEVSEDCHKALALVMDGWDESQGALYFTSRGYSRYGETLFKYGNHYFSR